MGNPSINQGVLRLMVAGVVQPDISFPLSPDNKITLGRDPNCDIPLDSYTSVSRHHGEIRPLKGESGEWVIYDLNSSHGTFINEKKIQGGQVLKAGDRIKLASEGPEFLFEYEQSTLTRTTNSIKKRQLTHNYEKIRKSTYWLESSPTKLIITHLRATYSIYTFVFIWAFLLISGLWIFYLPFQLIFSCIPKPVDYVFDLETGNFIIRSQGLVGWLFSQYRHDQVYLLKKFTAVRLEKSIYEGDEGTKYDTYSIFLERETGKAFQLPFTWRNNPEEAHELVELIEMYLKQVEE